jgi:hypothetical protein
MDDETRAKFLQELDEMIKEATDKEQAARDLEKQAEDTKRFDGDVV